MSDSDDDIPESSKRKAHEANLADAFCQFSPFKKPRRDGDPPSPDEAPHENRPRAMPRISYLLIAPEEFANLPRTLNLMDANPESPILCLDDFFEAVVVLNCPRFVENEKMFRVFDERKTPYDMQTLKLFKKNSLIEPYFISGWRSFVSDHNLEADDQILFEKNLDTTISDEFYYILKYVKNPESSKKPGDGAGSSRKPDDRAESSKKPGNGTESSTKLSDDGAESSTKPGDTIEISTKPGDTIEISTKPSDDSVQSVLGIGMPVFKVVYQRVLLETTRPRMPGSRPFQLEAICLSKTLTAAELESWLYFDVFDAIILTDNPRVAETLPGFSISFVMCDRDDRQFKMTLHHLEMEGGILGFYLDGWENFMKNHDLKRGDRVAFYKFLDRRVRYGYYYVVVELPADVDGLNITQPSRPGSRTLMPGSYCFSKILSQNDVSPGAAGLQLEVLQARHFESSRRSLNMPFMVFDRDDYEYEMKLSYYFNNDQALMCFLDIAEWHSFVLSNYLQAGDTIHVSKTFDHSICADHYFVITFTRAVFHGQLVT